MLNKDERSERRPVVIAGPTASGKSALALEIARRDDGCVINADALQVYGCWRILTARPSTADETLAPHALYGHVCCSTRYSVGAWLRDLAPLLDTLRARRQRPIIVGGTGLYLTALTEGLSPVPAIPPEIRARSQALLATGSIERFIDDLARDDPVTLARLDRANPMRLQRAWEVLVATDRGLADWHAATGRPLLPRDECCCIVIEMDKSSLNNQIAHRFDRMIELGALDECAAFLRSGLDRGLPSARALGAAELFAYLDGTLGLAEATAAATQATRRFAKRQRTWFRSRMADWTRRPPADALAAVPEA